MTDRVASIAIPGSSAIAAAGVDSDPPGAGALPEFLLGPENRLARVALETVLGGGNEHFNPIVFHGPTGTGKTHLAAGLVDAWRSRHRRSQATYAPAIDFARELTDAIEAQAVEDFRARYRQASLLALDDVDLLCSKEGAQRELVCTIDALLDAGGRVVLTSATAPEDLAGLMPNLAARLLAGLTVRLALPGVETRLVILRRLARSRQIPVGEAVLRLLAEKLCVAVPALLGALHELVLAARVDGGSITQERARQWLAQRSFSSEPSLREIAAVTSRHFSLKLADLRSPSRRRTVVAARGVAMYLARTLTAKSLKQIGSYFCGRDHTTVSHGCHKTRTLLETDPATRDAVRLLCDRLRAAGPP